MRLCSSLGLARPSSFNSRTPGGVRLRTELCPIITAMFQFTHPGRGATSRSLTLSTLYSGFNSRTPGGVRHRSTSPSWIVSGFQFTHPGRGATRSPTQPKQSRNCFNSRTPGGVRLGLATRPIQMLCFNSRTPGGVRQPREGRAPYITPVSIHAPREGCDHTPSCLVAYGRRFNSRTPGGVRPP